MNITIRVVNTLLLGAILWTLVQIRVHMPPTLVEMRSANAEHKKALILRRPFFNSVEIENTPLSVEIENTSLSVEVDNTPLAVQIER